MVEADTIDVEALKDNFTHLTFQRGSRIYHLTWVETLLGMAIVRIHGRKGRWNRHLAPLLFDTFEEAWPTIRAIIRKRLRNGYQIVSDVEDAAPLIRVSFGEADPEKLKALAALRQMDLYEEEDSG